MPIRASPNGASARLHAIHTPDAIARNRWTPSIGTGRHQSESPVAIIRRAHGPAPLDISALDHLCGRPPLHGKLQQSPRLMQRTQWACIGCALTLCLRVRLFAADAFGRTASRESLSGLNDLVADRIAHEGSRGGQIQLPHDRSAMSFHRLQTYIQGARDRLV